MSQSKTKAAKSPRNKEKRYPTERLLRSKLLSGYQQDFARVLLTEPEYTINEAKAILDKILKGAD